MGQLRDKKIIQSRSWLNPEQVSIPPYDFDFVYPITVYDAVNRTMDENSPNLSDELDSIYRLIADKQDIIPGGNPGQLMTWSGIKGQIGTMDIIKAINLDPVNRSHQKIPTERAVGDALDSKASVSALVTHIDNNSIHLTDIERTRWNSMASASSLQAHISNSTMHITDVERGRWNSKASASELDDHIYNTNNPHNVTAHQTGTYTRREIDEMIAAMRESFFNYVNIAWDDRTNQAELIKYHSTNWNPNYVLGVNDSFPDVSDPNLIYFALKPATDYLINETGDCIIYIKRPGLNWQEVGFSSMNAGDMVIKFPNTEMYVWIQGRFIRLFSDSSAEPSDGLDGNVWRPEVDINGYLKWKLSMETDPPDPVKVKGEDGRTPIKGIDYDDGKDGEGVAVGGNAGDLLVKLSNENFSTTWKSLINLLEDIALSGSGLPADVVLWDNIKGRPKWYNELGPNDDGFITQKAATRQFEITNNQITEILERVDGPGGIEGIKDSFDDHVNDYQNPHRVSAAIIGAVTIGSFNDHIQNFNNPHNVKASDLNLEKVDNTPDMDKPISNATQEALEELQEKLRTINNDVDGFNYVVNVSWNNTAGKLMFTFRDGSKLDVIIPITDIFNSMYFDNNTKELVILLPDGSDHRINIASLIQTYYGSTGANIQVVVENDNIIRASIIPGSVGEYEITPSVHLRSSPTTTTQPVSDRSNRIATTEFVAGQVINNLISYETDRPLSANMGRYLNQKKADIEDVIQIINDLEGISVIDTLDSTSTLAALSANMGRYLDLVKAPRVHTSPSGSTYGQSTISLFGHSRASEEDPLMDGTVFRGTDNGRFARGDHRHPTDITRAPLHSPDLTGEPKSTTPPDNSNDTRIATTWWVRQLINQGRYGTCSTAGNTAAKVSNNAGELPGFIRATGMILVMKFSNEDISTGITTLNIKGTGAANVQYRGINVEVNMIGKDHYALLQFDGTYWQLLNPCALVRLPDDDNSNRIVTTEWVRRNAVGVNKGTCPTAGNVALKVVTLKSDFMANPPFLRQTGSTITATFDYTDSSSGTTQLNVQGSGAANVIYGGLPVTANMISANHSHIFTFDGTNWRLLNPAGIHTLDDSDNSNRFVSSEWIRRNAPDVMYGTSTTASATATKVATLRSSYSANPVFVRRIGSTVVIKFTATDDSSGTTQLNVQGSGAAPVHFESRPVVPYMIDKDIDHIFTFDGTNWQLLNPSSMGTEIYGGSSSGATNQMTGFFGFTVEGHGGTTNSDGEVSRAIFSIPFKSIKPEGSKVTVSNNAADWGARMGDNQLVNLSNPVVLFYNRAHAVVQFTMVTAYPSNSPCGLVARRSQASIKVESDSSTIPFMPAASIEGIPSSMNVGDVIDLSSFQVAPVNATNQTVSWSIVNAGGTGAAINTGKLTVTSSGTFTIRATIINGATETTNFVKDFTISAVAGAINIITHPVSTEVKYGSITGSLFITASVGYGALSYQWYSNTTNSNTGGTVIAGATNSTFTIPTNLTNGTYYYFCQVSAPGGATSVRSNVATVKVIVEATGVTISPKPLSLLSLETVQLTATITPSNTTNKSVTWTTSDSSIASVNISGVLTTHKAGTVTVTATTVSGGRVDSFTTNVSSFTSITDITDVPDSVKLNISLPLTSTIIPSNATNQTIVWSVIDAKGTGAAITSGNILKATTDITSETLITIRATVANGIQPGVSYAKDFVITIKPDYVGVEDIRLPSQTTRIGEALTLSPMIIPIDATNQTVSWSIVNAGGTGASLSGSNILNSTSIGTAIIKATIVNGATKTTNYIQEFDITITEGLIFVTDIIDAPTSIFRNFMTDSIDLIVLPENATATGEDVLLEIYDPGPTNAIIDHEDETILATNIGTFKLQASVPDGAAYGIPFEKLFNVNVIEFIPVTNITDLPTWFRVDETLQLSGTIIPSNATNQTIVWSIVNNGGTGALIVTNPDGVKLMSPKTGTVRIRATIVKGIQPYDEYAVIDVNYTQDFNITVLASFIPITDITDLLSSMEINDSISLTGTIIPSNATNQSIKYTMIDDGGTNVSLIGNGTALHHPKNPGTIKMLATVVNGASDTSDYTKHFDVAVTSSLPVDPEGYYSKLLPGNDVVGVENHTYIPFDQEFDLEIPDNVNIVEVFATAYCVTIYPIGFEIVDVDKGYIDGGLWTQCVVTATMVSNSQYTNEKTHYFKVTPGKTYRMVFANYNTLTNSQKTWARISWSRSINSQTPSNSNPK